MRKRSSDAAEITTTNVSGNNINSIRDDDAVSCLPSDDAPLLTSTFSNDKKIVIPSPSPSPSLSPLSNRSCGTPTSSPARHFRPPTPRLKQQQQQRMQPTVVAPSAAKSSKTAECSVIGLSDEEEPVVKSSKLLTTSSRTQRESPFEMPAQTTDTTTRSSRSAMTSESESSTSLTTAAVTGECSCSTPTTLPGKISRLQDTVATATVAEQTASSTTGNTSRDYYFDSYSHHGIHEEMLKDQVRTRTYQAAILQNAHLFRDKIVLDVGCGTGILSMFAAQAGARHVIGIDCSSIIDQAQRIIERNGFSNTITLIKGKVEEVELPEGMKVVDIIISEWMGYFLLYESMLDTVLFARDKWLVKGDVEDNNSTDCKSANTDGTTTLKVAKKKKGIIFPDKAVMYLCAIEDAQVKSERIDFWKNVYGFDMTPIQEIAIREPVVDVVNASSILTNSVPILHIDILTCTKADLSFSSTFHLQAHRNDYIHGFCAYFECAFTQVHKPLGFSTAPFAKYTHWKQTVFYMESAITICEGEELFGTISCKPNLNNNRDLDIKLGVTFDGAHCKVSKETDYCLR